MSELDFVQRIAILEEQHRNTSKDIEELKEQYREDVQVIKDCLHTIQTQTSTWKNVFWGISIAVTFILGSVHWLLEFLGIDFKLPLFHK